MKIKIKYHTNITPLEKISVGDWVDLRLAENVILTPGEFKILSLGVSMELPEGYEAVMVPRSSTFKNYGIIQANHVALIDNSYCGDNDVWRFPAYATRDVFIPKDTRICQFRIQKCMDKIEFETVEHLGNEDRGGLGSTGRL